MAAIARQDSAQRQQMSAHCFKTVCMAPSCATAMRSHSATHASQVSAQTRHVSRGGAPPADNSYSSAETPEKLCPFPPGHQRHRLSAHKSGSESVLASFFCGVIRASCPFETARSIRGKNAGVRGIAGVGLAECCEGLALSGQATYITTRMGNITRVGRVGHWRRKPSMIRKAHVLGVAHGRIRACRRQPVRCAS